MIPFRPQHNLACLSLQLAVERGLPPEDSTWATVWGIEDGEVKPRPLFRLDVPAFVEHYWAATDG